MGQGWETCDPAIRRWVEEAVEALTGVLGARSVGVYLHGSLAAGSFHPPKSDVDVLFVAREPLAPPRRERFARRCIELSEGRPLVGGLECSVVLERHARDPVHPMPFEVHYGQEHAPEILAGKVGFGRTRKDGDLAAHCQAVREHGVALRGPEPLDLFGPVPRADFMDSIHADLAWILSGRNILESPYYGVLNGCRLLWVWRGHSARLVPSKEEAALWAPRVLPPALHAVVGEALDAYRDDRAVDPAERASAGRAWDAESLLAFRDHLRIVAPPEVTGRVTGE